MTIALVNGLSIQARGVGIVALSLLVDGADIYIDLHDVYYYPELESNLILLGTLEKKGFFYTARNGILQVFRSNLETALEANRVSTLYIARLGTQANSKTEIKSFTSYKAAIIDL